MNDLFYVSGGVGTTYSEFGCLVESRACKLAPFRGQVIGIWADNGPGFVVNLFAAWRAGAIPFLISRRMPWEGVSGLLQSSAAGALIATDLMACEGLPIPVMPLSVEPGADVVVADLPTIGSRDQDIAVILHTSGTTSAPKLVRLTRTALHASLTFEAERWRGLWTEQDITLGWLPLYHSFGLVSELLHAYGTKSRYHFVDPTPRALLESLETEPITLLSSVPWMLEQLLDLPGGASALSRLRWIVVGGAPLSEELGERLERAGVRVIQQHGMTEVGAVFRGDPNGSDWRAMLPVIPERYWHLDEDCGELVIHADCPTLTQSTGDQPFRTRDAFRKVATSSYCFQIRLDDVLVHANGEKSNALAIEQALGAELRSYIERLVVVGAGRLRLACLIQWKQATPTAEQRALLVNAIDKVNGALPGHSRLDVGLTLAIDPVDATRIPLSPKGTVVREQLVKEFHAELERLYAGGTCAMPPALSTMQPWQSLPRETLRGELRRLVRATAAEVKGSMGVETVDSRRGFAEQGFDSLMAVQICERLSRALGVAVTASALFDYPSVDALSDHLSLRFSELPEEAVLGACPTTATSPSGPVAVIGAACRFPGGAQDLEGFWGILKEQRVTVSDIPDGRWEVDDWYDPDPGAQGKSYVRRASFLEDVQGFDAGFFHISPREAVSMDPQQRLLLEVTWEALEHAGQDPTALRHGTTGVFVGMSSADYVERVDPGAASAVYGATGNAPSIAAGRLSFFLGLQGPCFTVDTACSSSLSAVHLACQSLRNGECAQAIVGAVNVLASRNTFVYLSRMGVLAPDGQCKPFSAFADGFGRAEGCAALVLKRYDEAVRDGDSILAVIRGSAMNNDGPSSGLTVPNGPAQQALVREALRRAGLSSRAVDFVECHGTGTLLGDPIEIAALGAVFGELRDEGRPLRIGAVKANLGHLEAAAGLAGLLKVVLALQHEELPGQPPLEALNPHVPWSSLPLEVTREPTPWTRGERPRIAGVSSFGLGGTNVHVILEEGPAPRRNGIAPEASPEQPLAYLLSAKSDSALRAQAHRLHRHLGAHDELRLQDVAHSLQAARTAFERRAVLVATSHTALLEELEALSTGRSSGSTLLGTARSNGKLAVLFSGQGSQRTEMGKELYASVPDFRGFLDEVFAAFAGKLSQSLETVMFALPGTEPAKQLDQTGCAQPALFALEVALYRTIEQWGVRPALLLGHSIGEITAAHVAGVLHLDDACSLVAARARLMQAVAARGGMTAVEAKESEVEELLRRWPDRLSLAAVNGPCACVVSGDVDALTEIEACCRTQGHRTTRLDVSHAFHSSHLDSMLTEFERVLSRLSYGEARIPVVSNLTGKLAGRAELASPQYWVRHARQTVRFAAGVRALEEQGARTFLELGPQGTLTALARSCVSDKADTTFCTALRRGRPELESFLQALGSLHVVGEAVDFGAVLALRGACKVSLPTYAFQHSPYWLEPRESCATVGDRIGNPLLGAVLALADGSAVFSTTLSMHHPNWLCGHVVFGHALLPGTAFLEMAVAAGERMGASVVDELVMHRPLTLPETGGVDIQVLVGPADELAQRTFAIHARQSGTQGPWTQHAGGRLARAEALDEPDREELTCWPPEFAEAIPLDGFYAQLAQRGFEYGDAFRGLTRAWRREDDIFVEAQLPSALGSEAAAYRIHPALLDAALHALATPAAGEQVALPFLWSGVRLRSTAATQLRVKLSPGAPASGAGVTAVSMWDGAGKWAGSARGLLLRPLPAALSVNDSSERAFQVRWLPASPVRGTESHAPFWVVLGDASDGIPGRHYRDLAAFRAALDRKAALGGTAVLAYLKPDSDVLRGAYGAAERLLEILREWAADARLDASRLAVVTHRAVAVSEDEDVPALAHAPLWGLVRSAQAEYPDRFLLIDVDDTHEQALGSALALALGQAHGSAEPQLAVRKGRLLVPRLSRAVRSTAPAIVRTSPDLRSGTVLITGGMGTLGGLLARHLVKAHGVRHLLLCSRRSGGDLLKQELEVLGASVDLVSCDLSDREAVRAMLMAIPPHRPLVAVMHAAAALKDSVLRHHGREHIERSFSGKLKGAWHLHELTVDSPLAAFVLFSSISGVFGNAGQLSYSAANTFLDALAYHRRARGLAGLSLAWGYWGEKSGLTRDLGEIILARMARHGVQPMSTELALAMFDEALCGEGALRVPVRLDLTALAAQRQLLPVILRDLVGGQSTERDAAVEWRQRLVTLDAQEAETALLELVRQNAAVVFGVSPQQVDPERRMTDLGLDSVMAVELRSRLEGATGIRVGAAMVLDFPTPLAIARQLRHALSSFGGGSQ